MKRSKKTGFFPILINLRKYPCLVIGGGKVALRKVTTLMNFNASVTVLSPMICKPLINLAEKSKIRLIKKPYNKLYIKNFELIFCATDNPEINLTVYSDCKAEKKLLNVADVPELCDFILPATFKRGDLSISVSSQGKAPFYASETRRKLEHIFPAYYKDIIDLAAEYRSMIIGNKNLYSHKLKEEAFKKFFNIDWKNVLDQKGKANAFRYLTKISSDL
jgi:siroheme synthase-like protein